MAKTPFAVLDLFLTTLISDVAFFLFFLFVAVRGLRTSVRGLKDDLKHSSFAGDAEMKIVFLGIIVLFVKHDEFLVPFVLSMAWTLH